MNANPDFSEGRPTATLSVTADNKPIPELSEGELTIGIRYTPASNENHDGLSIFKFNAVKGKALRIEDAWYENGFVHQIGDANGVFGVEFKDDTSNQGNINPANEELKDDF